MASLIVPRSAGFMRPGSRARHTVSLVLVGLLLWALAPAVRWVVWDAVWHADEAACRAALGQGACWGVVAEKLRPILFGRYPWAEQWRPLVAMAVIALLIGASSRPQLWHWPLLPAWLTGLGLFVGLMGGGWSGLAPVPTAAWGGLPLTLLLAVVATTCALPLGIVLALARRSAAPLIRTLATTYIEVVRGVPLVTVLFMASFLVPLLLPAQWQPGLLWRVMLALVLFSAAYMAEVVRGGLQTVSQHQVEAARALGMSAAQIQRLVVLPLALRAAVPALMNSFIGTLKDTSLVTVVGLYELTGALSLALGGDPAWRSFYLEGYLFVAALYWVLCFGLSRYSRRLEQVHRP